MAPRVLAEAYRAVVGVTEAECSDAEALDRMLNPARNPYRLETMNVGVHAPLMRPLQHAHFTFAKKISHTADSQDQRHRMVPGSRPLLVLTDTRSPDFITPMLIRENRSRPRSVRERHGRRVGREESRCSISACRRNSPLYLLPNAKAIRLVESGSLLHLLHKWTMRTCFNAQEEIYQASIEELEQVRAAVPGTGALHRSALLRSRRHRHADLHGRLALLRHQGLAGFSQHRAAHMTRHGTLAYYLAAWVIGCPVVALVFWLIESVQTGSASSSALLEICFFALDVRRSGFTPVCFPSAPRDARSRNAKRRGLGLWRARRCRFVLVFTACLDLREADRAACSRSCLFSEFVCASRGRKRFGIQDGGRRPSTARVSPRFFAWSIARSIV